MSDQLIRRREIEFQMYEMFDFESTLSSSTFSDHNRETVGAMLDVAEKLAKEKFVNHSAKNDQQEPQFKQGSAELIPEVKEAWDAFADAGFLAARMPIEAGGMNVPEMLMANTMAIFTAANVGTSGYPFLTVAAARLLHSYGSDELKDIFLPGMLNGRFSGTMALTEPEAGSSLADIQSKATPREDGTYGIRGNKIYISGGDQNITENIVHMVLAKLPDAPAGVKGISLFLVPKFLVNKDGALADRNDVALAGLFHKMGYKGTTSTALNFGEKDQCVGYLIGEPHQGLKYMFQMMNEARLGVGFGATAIGYRGYMHSLDYARERTQGRSVTNKDPDSKQVTIIKHTDVKRMLLAQKAYTEGALALCNYGAKLVDQIQIEEDQPEVTEKTTDSKLLLDLLTPIIKAWPSEFGPKANDLAIQVLGGAGYTREYPVEQCYRDNRLNPIHEGTNGIQGLDLMGRKIWQENGKGLTLLVQEISQTLAATPSSNNAFADQLAGYLQKTQGIIAKTLELMAKKQIDLALANTDSFLKLLGHQVIAWLWLKQSNIAEQALAQRSETLPKEEQAYYLGKRQAARYFFHHELPLCDTWIGLLQSADDTCLVMEEAWF